MYITYWFNMALFKKQKLAENMAYGNDPQMQEVVDRFSVAITDEAFSAMRTTDLSDPVSWKNDPVARQYVPSVEELKTLPDELEDPIGDTKHSPVKGIVHRYPDRVLLMPVHVCAVYCRFCFRREKVGANNDALSPDDLKKALAYIRNTPEVWEVIVTGGDPFVLSPRRIREIMNELNAIEHVKIIRFHTRVPIADPQRVTDDLVMALESEKAVYVVVHCNHAQELTENVRQATRRILKSGVPLLSQSTLLKGVNDTPESLESLFRQLTAFRIKPYYLHHPDRARGTSHFRVSLKTGRALVRQLWGRMSGIAQPAYVLDIPQGYGKIPVMPPMVAEDAEGYILTDYKNGQHRYKEKP